MVISCVAFGCTNRQECSGQKLMKNEIPISFHRFPNKSKKQEIYGRWLRSVKRWKWAPTKYSYVCSDHFLITDYKVAPWEKSPRLKKGTVPSIYPSFPQHLKKKAKKRSTLNSSLVMEISEPAAEVDEPAAESPLQREKEKKRKLKEKVRKMERKLKTLHSRS